MLFLLNLFLIARSNFSIKYKKAPYTADTYTRNKTITNPFTAVFIFLSSIRHYHKMIYLFPLPCFLSFILPFRYSSFSHYLPHRYPQLPCLLHPIQHCSLQGSSSEPFMIASNRSLCAKICASHPFSVMYRHP